MAADFVGNGINIPRFLPCLAIVLAAKIQDFILESLVAVPAVP
jgi:hypothetical protein